MERQLSVVERQFQAVERQTQVAERHVITALMTVTPMTNQAVTYNAGTVELRVTRLLSID